MEIRGGMTTISSAAAEQSHSSNEVACPTKLMGIVSPEEQLYEMLRRLDDWVMRVLDEVAELELDQLMQSRTMHEGSPEHKALICL